MVGGSLQILLLLPPLKVVAMIFVIYKSWGEPTLY
jgi:hypothetical protein